MSKKVLMQGNAACVHGAIKAGMRFFAGYPITPSTEIAEMSSLLLPKVGGHFIQMEDELASSAAIIGASSVGIKSMTDEIGKTDTTVKTPLPKTSKVLLITLGVVWVGIGGYYLYTFIKKKKKAN